MNKRLRKKYKLGEFKEYGFQARIKFALDEQGREDLLCDFIKFVDAQGLVCGGGGTDDEWDLFMTGKTGSATEQNRADVTQWLVNEKRITAYVVGPMIDAWNDPLEDLSPKYQTK